MVKSWILKAKLIESEALVGKLRDKAQELQKQLQRQGNLPIGFLEDSNGLRPVCRNPETGELTQGMTLMPHQTATIDINLPAL